MSPIVMNTIKGLLFLRLLVMLLRFVQRPVPLKCWSKIAAIF